MTQATQFSSGLRISCVLCVSSREHEQLKINGDHSLHSSVFSLHSSVFTLQSSLLSLHS